MGQAGGQKTPFFSIIIPVYQCEKYIQECITSVLEQDFTNLEVLLIDDCSPDNAWPICQQIGAKDSRVKLWQLEKNSGPGAARNHGLAKARGEYVLFLDSDDFYMQGSLTALYQKIKRYQPDVLHGTEMYILTEGENVLRAQTFLQWGGTGDIRISREEAYQKFCQYQWNGAAVNKVFRREFLLAHKLSFCHAPLQEDILFGFKALWAAKCYVLTDWNFYACRERQDSTTHQQNRKHNLLKGIRALLTVAQELRDFTAQQKKTETAIAFDEDKVREVFLAGIVHFFFAHDIKSIGGAMREYVTKELAGQYDRNLLDSSLYLLHKFMQQIQLINHVSKEKKLAQVMAANLQARMMNKLDE